MPNFTLSDEVFTRAAGQFPTPFHLYDENGILSAVRDLKEAFAWAPAFREYFAVKALPNPRILEIFRDEGCGLDCSSMCELLMAERSGFSGDGIMFSANAMPPEEYTKARALGAVINLDDISDIDILLSHGGIPEEVCMRFNPGGELKGGSAIMGQPGESKYGMTRKQMSRALQRLKELGVKRFGLHALLASNSIDREYYPALARILFTVGRELREESGLALSFINLSGGIGIPYRPEDKPNDIRAIGSEVKTVYEEIFGSAAPGSPAICTEMGRFMTGPYGWLVTRAVHEKKIYKDYIGVDACASCLMRPAMYGAYHHIHVVGKRDEPCDRVYDITGALCENNDKFAWDRPLPEIGIGDLLVIHDTGAHGLAMGYQYNGRLRCAEILLTREGNLRLIRRAETPEDYFRTLL